MLFGHIKKYETNFFFSFTALAENASTNYYTTTYSWLCEYHYQANSRYNIMQQMQLLTLSLSAFSKNFFYVPSQFKERKKNLSRILFRLGFQYETKIFFSVSWFFFSGVCQFGMNMFTFLKSRIFSSRHVECCSDYPTESFYLKVIMQSQNFLIDFFAKPEIRAIFGQ